MQYDPQTEHQTDCTACPLAVDGRAHRPCPPRIVTSSKLFIIGEGPGKAEERLGEPFIGASGLVLDEALKSAKQRRVDVSITNITKCRAGRKLQPQEWRKAVQCCAPSVDAETRQVDPDATVLALGRAAIGGTTGKWSGKLDDWALTPLPGRGAFAGHTVVPSYHPAFVMRKPAFLPMVRLAVSRAVQLSRGALPLLWPPLLIVDGPEMQDALRAMLGTSEDIAVDIETAGMDPRESPLLCVGVSDGTHVVSVPWPCYPETEDLLRQVLALPNIKLMHNAGHDATGLAAKGLPLGGDEVDTLLMHATLAPQLPHNLQYTAACYLPVEPWKKLFRAGTDLKGMDVFAKRDQYELRTYNAKDTYATWRAKKEMSNEMQRRPYFRSHFERLAALSQLGRKMSLRGAQVDRSRFVAHDERLASDMRDLRERFREQVTGLVELGANGQNPALTEFFADHLNATLGVSETTGAPSLNKAVLKKLIAEGNEDQRIAASIVLSFRQAAKLRSTYLYGLPLDTSDVMHPNWKVWGTVTRRWSSSEPNAQNVPKNMRDIVVARPGFKFVCADYSQLEGRIIGAISGEPKLVDGFAAGDDMHTINARALFPGKSITKAGPERKVAKIFWYAIAYGAQAETVHAQARLGGSNLSLDAVAYLMANLKRGLPTLFAWQTRHLAQCARQGYVTEPFTDWRRYFHDARVELNAALNHPLQAGAGSIVNDAILRIAAELDWSRGECIIFQIHDEIVLEVPKDRAEWAEELLRRVMPRRLELVLGKVVELTVDSGSGYDWAELE